MMDPQISKTLYMDNPLKHILTDQQFEQLRRLDLFNERGIRDIRIKRRYKELLSGGDSSVDAILSLRKQYPHLQFDTLRKIIYSTCLPEEF